MSFKPWQCSWTQNIRHRRFSMEYSGCFLYKMFRMHKSGQKKIIIKKVNVSHYLIWQPQVYVNTHQRCSRIVRWFQAMQCDPHPALPNNTVGNNEVNNIVLMLYWKIAFVLAFTHYKQCKQKVKVKPYIQMFAPRPIPPQNFSLHPYPVKFTQRLMYAVAFMHYENLHYEFKMHFCKIPIYVYIAYWWIQ